MNRWPAGWRFGQSWCYYSYFVDFTDWILSGYFGSVQIDSFVNYESLAPSSLSLGFSYRLGILYRWVVYCGVLTRSEILLLFHGGGRILHARSSWLQACPLLLPNVQPNIRNPKRSTLSNLSLLKLDKSFSWGTSVFLFMNSVEASTPLLEFPFSSSLSARPNTSKSIPFRRRSGLRSYQRRISGLGLPRKKLGRYYSELDCAHRAVVLSMTFELDFDLSSDLIVNLLDDTCYRYWAFCIAWFLFELSLHAIWIQEGLFVFCLLRRRLLAATTILFVMDHFPLLIISWIPNMVHLNHLESNLWFV